ncbi:MAG TPA: glutamine synthetase beta-grasp domain-containing protein, partial [Acidimicrobiales bacterium]|nr:glutamine synthetase beta-grasp domain-containing protein [Acidimicrobiales bacterium]
MPYQAEYIWIDGTEPSPLLRSKTKVVADGEEPGIWGFDGSSTNQALGHDSDCVLRPVFSCPDPLRGPDDKLVMCEVELTDFSPHPTNTRAKVREVAEKYADQEPMFGIEQEYTFFKDGRPLGWPVLGFPAPQGPYYCGVGGDKMPGREIVELHTAACIDAGIGIEGTNAEVMMGQWEFQVGVLSAPSPPRRARSRPGRDSYDQPGGEGAAGGEEADGGERHQVGGVIEPGGEGQATEHQAPAQLHPVIEGGGIGNRLQPAGQLAHREERPGEQEERDQAEPVDG